MAKKEFDVISFGSAIVDVFVDTDLNESGDKLCMPVDAKIAVKNIKFLTGGGGTNTSAAIANLGLKAGFLGKNGKGHNAGIILRDLEKYGEHFLGIAGDHKTHTGYSIIIDSKQRNRTILTYRGVNNNLSFKE